MVMKYYNLQSWNTNTFLSVVLKHHKIVRLKEYDIESGMVNFIARVFFFTNGLMSKVKLCIHLDDCSVNPRNL